MTEHVLLTDDSAVRIVRLNAPERKSALTRAFSLLATARSLRAAAAEPAGLGSDAVDAAQVEDAVQAAFALSGTCLRGGHNDVVLETMPFKKRPQSDETSAAIGAFLSGNV